MPSPHPLNTDRTWSGYWRRDLARHGARWPLAEPGDDPAEDAPLWSGAVPAHIRVWCGIIGIGLVGGLSAMEGLLRSGVSAQTVGAVAVLAWGPWLLAGLSAVHAVRALVLRYRPHQTRQAFLDACAAAGCTDPDVALSVRAALARVYGTPEPLIHASDTGSRLSWYMEQPLRTEFCEAFLACWRCGRSPVFLAARLGPLSPSTTVADLARLLSA